MVLARTFQSILRGGSFVSVVPAGEIDRCSFVDSWAFDCLSRSKAGEPTLHTASQVSLFAGSLHVRCRTADLFHLGRKLSPLYGLRVRDVQIVGYVIYRWEHQEWSSISDKENSLQLLYFM